MSNLTDAQFAASVRGDALRAGMSTEIADILARQHSSDGRARRVKEEQRRVEDQAASSMRATGPEAVWRAYASVGARTRSTPRAAARPTTPEAVGQALTDFALGFYANPRREYARG